MFSNSTLIQRYRRPFGHSLCLKELVGPSHMRFGSDYPFAPEVAVDLEMKSLAELTLLNNEQKIADRKSESPCIISLLAFHHW
ncbi:hypothetical protein [Escherichia coli]|uniref:Amidohydrolase n=1 Tax=Escherichia coli TaxID=562 RepID=A0A3P5DJ02_ECOLX|nr:hypothetical protein [Escherichia coli]MCW4341396.1 hypothetical protein [Klebsiella pneumoniae]EFM3381563.1 hypothetical protein [Escherichia coli]EJD6362637.1 hypothetical protein [Escherichia coli]EKU0742146.1 hypothetical protein [Escherichia coli]EKU9042849.1 hypothetical protein [Escherichia coli]